MRYSLASMVGMATTFFSIFLFHFPNKSILSLPCLLSPLTMYNKTIIGFGFCDMQNYQRFGKRPRHIDNPHITKTSSNNLNMCDNSKLEREIGLVQIWGGPPENMAKGFVMHLIKLKPTHSPPSS